MKELVDRIVSMIKQYLKHGIAVIIPITLVVAVSVLIYNYSSKLVKAISNVYELEQYLGVWAPIITIASILLLIFILGVIFKHLKILRWLKGNTEKYIIDNIPVLNKVYNFGKEISDTFISDIKEDGDMTVVEVYMGSITMMGLLTDPKNDLVFVVSAPSPLTGFVLKTNKYKILDMTFMDLVQINTSLGRINGSKWSNGISKKKWNKEIENKETTVIEIEDTKIETEE